MIPATSPENATPYLFESDVAAIKTFLREMVVQSVVPHMESRVVSWNDQVASRRRGISGRFMSISKRWAGFGSGSRNSSGPANSNSGSGSGNYDTMQGFYGPDTPEAILRKMADYAFMLRDWKLSLSTYEMLRTDYNNDKAWKYLAGANEMSAISTLLNPQAMTARTRAETVEQMLQTASYSYLTRCSDSFNALRCLTLGMELLKVRGGSAADDAAKWATRVLDLGLLGSIGGILFEERISACFASRLGSGSAAWGSRRRKAALWSILAADAWLKQGNRLAAEARLNEAEQLYNSTSRLSEVSQFAEMRRFLENLRYEVSSQGMGAEGTEDLLSFEPEESEDTSTQPEVRGHRKSKSTVGGLDGASSPPFAQDTVETLDHRSGHRKSMSLMGHLNVADQGPLSPSRREQSARDDDFE